MICSSSMRRSSRGTPGVKKNRARPMSRAKPQAVPIGLSITSAVVGSIACFLLFGGITRLRLHAGGGLLARHEVADARYDAPLGARRKLRQLLIGAPGPRDHVLRAVQDHGGNGDCRPLREAALDRVEPRIARRVAVPDAIG